MFFRDWKKDLFTIPNLLSLLRLALIPVYMTIYLRADTPAGFYLAGGILAVSCLTDLLDGCIARRLHMVTNLGKLLDPLADKATQLTLTLCLSLRHSALVPVLLALVIKEVFQLAAGLLLLRQGRVLCGALPTGKVCTAVLFASLILLVLFPGIPTKLVGVLAAVDLTALALSFLCYTVAFFGKGEGHFQDLQ